VADARAFLADDRPVVRSVRARRSLAAPTVRRAHARHARASLDRAA
jgi:hypothetical protein